MSDTDHVAARRFLADVKPYAVPDSLDDLRGPDGGVVRLSRSVLWAPGDGTVDIDRAGGTVTAYEAVISEGEMPEQIAVLNCGRLIRTWAELVLPARVRALWEGRFTELAAIPSRW